VKELHYLMPRKELESSPRQDNMSKIYKQRTTVEDDNKGKKPEKISHAVKKFTEGKISPEKL